MKSNHGLRRLVSVCLLVCLCFSMLGQSTFEVHAEEKDFKKVTFSLDSNVVEKSSIDLYLYEDVYYIAIDDLCSLTRCSQSKENEIISIRQGFWSTKFDIGNQTFDDEYQKVDTTILEIEENKYAVPAVMFLNYFKATAYTKGDKLYCKMPEFTAWEALDVNYEDTLIDIYELYGGEGNVAFSLTLDIIMDFITGDMANSEKYLSDAFVEALEVTVNDRDSVKEYKESIIQNLYSELHSDEIDDFLESLQDRLSISAEPVEWYIESHYNSLEKSFVRLAYDAHEAGNYDEVKNYGKKFYDAFAEKNRVSKGAEKFFNNMDYLMVFISAAAETANEMKYTDATNNLVYNVMGQENLQYLGISADDDLWFTVADKYQSVLGTGIKQLESKLTNFFTDKLFWENATGAIVSNSAGISLGSWTLSLNASRFIAKNINPITRGIIEGFEADRRGLYLSELQQKVYWVLSNTVKKFEGQLDNKDVYAKYIEAEQLYCRTSVAMYENLIKMVKHFGENPDYWTDYFQERIDMLAISLYQLTSIQDDGVINCLPLDLSTFTVKNRTSTEVKLKYEMQKETIEFHLLDGTLYYSNTIEYPYFSGNSAIESTLNQRYADMISECKTNDTDFDASYQENLEWGLDVSALPFYDDTLSEVVYNDRGAFSIKETYLMWSGGAHPYHYETALNYDLTTGAELTYFDILDGTDEEIDTILRYYFEKSLWTPTDYEVSKLKEYTAYALCKDGLCFYYNVGDAVPRAEIIIPYTSDDTYIISVNKLL